MRDWNSAVSITDNEHQHLVPMNYHEVSRDLHCVLQDKCEDPEGLARIRAAKGDGIKAYSDMYSWYLGKSGVSQVRNYRVGQNLLCIRLSRRRKVRLQQS